MWADFPVMMATTFLETTLTINEINRGKKNPSTLNPYYFIRQYISWERLYYLSLWFWEHFGMWWRSSFWDDYGPVCHPCQSTLLPMLCLTSSWFTLQCFHNFINSVWGFDVFAICTAFCEVNICLRYVSRVTSSWILVAMTAPTAASVLWPHSVNVVCSLRKPFFCGSWGRLVFCFHPGTCSAWTWTPSS